MDLSGTTYDVFFQVLSDGSVWYFGGGYPPAEYTPVSEWPDETCLTNISTRTHIAGINHDGSLTLIDSTRSFSVGDLPQALSSPGPFPVTSLRTGPGLLALDAAGVAWAMWPDGALDDTFGKSGAFVQLPLPAPVSSIDADAGFCAVLATGAAWCMDPKNYYVGRFGLGEDVDMSSLTELPIANATHIAMGSATLCYLDVGGVTRCAGSSLGDVLGYPSQMFDNNMRASFDVVPGLPPLKRIWMRQFGACGVTSGDDLWCWGETNTSEHSSPALISHLPGMSALAFTDYATCLIRGDGRVVCRGITAESYSCGTEDGWYVIGLPHSDCFDWE